MMLAMHALRSGLLAALLSLTDTHTYPPPTHTDMVVSQADQQKAAQVAASQGGGARKLLRL